MSGLNICRIYIPMQELSDLVVNKLSDDDKVKFEGFGFVPIKMGLNENDFSIEFMFAPTPISSIPSSSDDKPRREHLELYSAYAN